MTQIKNINAMQELTEVQEDMADTHDKFHNKSLKGKKGYITFARTKEGMFICGDGESSVIKGIQARVLVGEEVLADCYWTEKEGINLCPITFSTYTDDENDQIIGSVFIQGGIHITVAYSLSAVCKGTYHFFLRFAGFQHFIDVLCLRHRQVQHICRLHICGFLEQRNQLW